MAEKKKPAKKRSVTVWLVAVADIVEGPFYYHSNAVLVRNRQSVVYECGPILKVSVPRG